MTNSNSGMKRRISTEFSDYTHDSTSITPAQTLSLCLGLSLSLSLSVSNTGSCCRKYAYSLQEDMHGKVDGGVA